MADSPWIIATTQATFERDVMQKSQEVPVLVDFWATWCQPCRLLAPVLEKLAQEFAGRFVLVKAETEQVPEAAAAFGVQGIPAVYAVVRGEVVDGFAGLLPENQLQAWIARVIGLAEYEQAQQLETSNPAAAKELYERLQAEDPQQARPQIGLARVALAQGDAATAESILQQLAERGFLEPEAEKVRAALDLQAKKSLDVEALRQQAAADADNLNLQIDLAEGLAAREQFPEALDLLLDVIERDTKECRERARETMLGVFRVLPDDSELTTTYRRRLASALF